MELSRVRKLPHSISCSNFDESSAENGRFEWSRQQTWQLGSPPPDLSGTEPYTSARCLCQPAFVSDCISGRTICFTAPFRLSTKPAKQPLRSAAVAVWQSLNPVFPILLNSLCQKIQKHSVHQFLEYQRACPGGFGQGSRCLARP